jgi:inner membrane transporter RhtA
LVIAYLAVEESIGSDSLCSSPQPPPFRSGSCKPFPICALLAAAVGVGVSSSAIPYVTDQLAMARLPRATFALMISILPATATAIGVLVLRPVPSALALFGIGLVIVGIALHRNGIAR